MDWDQISAILHQVGVVIEKEYLPKFLDAISINIDKSYDYFHKNNILYRTDQSDIPTQEELRDGSIKILANSKKKSAVIGAIGGLGGFITLVPESAGSLIHAYRCTQRLSLLYGLDPLNHQQMFTIMMRSQNQKQLSTVSSTSNTTPTSESVLFAQKVVKNIAYSSALKRLRKIIPGIGSGFGAWQGYMEMETFGKNLVNILKNESFSHSNPTQVSEAEEISRNKFT
jgi:hypothetical protein